MGEVDDIVEKLPPPGKLKPGGEVALDPAADPEYSPEEDSAMQVAKALGADPETVDIPALCEALKGFIAITRE